MSSELLDLPMSSYLVDKPLGVNVRFARNAHFVGFILVWYGFAYLVLVWYGLSGLH